jgi:tetratricopeptide (TPR) repeat protein
MMGARIWGWAVALLLVSATAGVGAAANPSAANASTDSKVEIAALLAQGDAFDARLDNARALQSYLQAEKLGATDPDTLTHVARQYALLMNDAQSDDQQRRLGEKALEYSKRAVAENPAHAKSVLSVAICYGRLVRFQDTRTKIEYSRYVKDYAEKALKLDPTDSYAWHVLGAWNYELAQMGAFSRAIVKVVYGGMPPASNEEAERLFRKAVELAPERVSHHAELGRTLAALGKKNEARLELNKALALPSREKDDAESKKRATETLARLD